ncbi:MAG: phytanoyl-CoA dioxygenase family protein [Phenylobacterium sp.]|uniref:phytanoyl-CoA dioxygenase family protein n=1 Tax=Phenylobacterium sp. TaxID=1871053 RepID=UPI00391DF1FC
MGLFSLGRRKAVAPWFESDDLEPYLARSRFDPETESFIRDFARDGVVAVDLGDEARRLCDQAVAETEPYFVEGVSRVQDAWYRSPAVRRLATWPKMRRLLKAAYGRDPFPFQTLNFRQGSQQGVHSDTIHFHSAPERFMCGVWIALEDVRPEAGPLIYYPGSHKLPVMTMRGAGVNNPEPTYDDYVAAYVPRYAAAIEASGLPRSQALIKKGWAFVWAANLAHGGAPIEKPGATRRSLVVHNYFENCIYYTPMLSDVEAGRLHVRLPPNLRTGLPRWPRRGWRPVRLPKHLVIEALRRDLAREPAVM